MAKEGPPIVLSIQSEVVYGHVGNSAARPILNALGIELLALPTVLLAHHPGHAPVSGAATPAGEMVAILDRLERLKILDKVDAVLSGYLVDPAQVGVVLQAVERVRDRNPRAQFWCDPVMGDDPKGFYVAEAVAGAIRDHLVPIADLLIPNRFEAAWLSGIEIRDSAGAALAASKIGPRSVVVTSVMEENEIGALWWNPERVFYAKTAKRKGVPGGLGDAFAALLLGLKLTGSNDQRALERAVSALAALLDAAIPEGWPPELPLAAKNRIIADLI